MKKLALSIAIVLGMALGATAQQSSYFSNGNKNTLGGGLFGRGYATSEYEGYRDGMTSLGLLPGLPNHLQEDDQDAPVGSGIAVLLGLGAAYLVGKRRKED